MWSRSSTNKTTGLMTVVCTDWHGAEFYRGEFRDVAAADRAGEDAERRMTLAMRGGAATQSLDDGILSDDELLAELSAMPTIHDVLA